MRWFISDLHFGHKNIINYCSRPFDNVKAMDTMMIECWNKVVAPEDEVFVVGDFSFYPVGQTEEIARTLHGTKHLIKGNHDQHRKDHYWRKLFKTVSERSQIFIEPIGRSVELYHYPQMNFAGPQILVHGHSHNYRAVVSTYVTTRQLLVNVSVEGLGYTPMSEEKLSQIIQQHEEFLRGEG